MTITQTLSRAHEIFRTEGVAGLAKSIYRASVPIEKRLSLKVFRYRYTGHPGIGNPLKPIFVPPSLITQYISNSFVDEPIGKVISIRDSDWDRQGKPLERTPQYRYIKKYHGSRPIHDRTEVVPKWNVSEQHLVDFEHLYESIKSNGYREQDELDANGSILSEINVCIGRDGVLIVKNGRHRASIAKLLDIEKIPVYVRVRHKDWQKLRDEAWKVDSIHDLSQQTRQFSSHPDIRTALRNNRLH